MNDDASLAYLRQVLAFDPRTEAAAIVRTRANFLSLRESGIVVAESAENEGRAPSLQERMRQQLNELRDNFWQLPEAELLERLESVRRVGHAETASVAGRLIEVARLRPALRELRNHYGIEPAFVNTFVAILLAPAGEANRLREREHGWLRPTQNKHYQHARHKVQNSIRIIHARFPKLYQLEHSWLTELLEYNPYLEVKESNSRVAMNAFGGVLFLVWIFLTFKIVVWVFS